MKRGRTLAFAGIFLLLILSVSFAWWNRVREAEQAERSAIALEQGIALFERKNYDEALLELDKILEGSLDDWRVSYYRGSAQMMLKDYQAAAASLEQSLVLDNTQPGTLYALGVAYYKLGKLKLARGYFESVLEINPNDAHAKGLVDIMAKMEKQSDSPDLTAEPEPTDAQ